MANIFGNIFSFIIFARFVIPAIYLIGYMSRSEENIGVRCCGSFIYFYDFPRVHISDNLLPETSNYRSSISYKRPIQIRYVAVRIALFLIQICLSSKDSGLMRWLIFTLQIKYKRGLAFVFLKYATCNLF